MNVYSLGWQRWLRDSGWGTSHKVSDQWIYLATWRWKRKKLNTQPPVAKDIAIMPKVGPNNGIVGPDIQHSRRAWRRGRRLQSRELPPRWQRLSLGWRNNQRRRNGNARTFKGVKGCWTRPGDGRWTFATLTRERWCQRYRWQNLNCLSWQRCRESGRFQLSPLGLRNLVSGAMRRTRR